MIYYQDERLTVRDMCEEDAQSLFDAEKRLRYGDKENRFPMRVRDAEAGKCIALVAVWDGEPVGYVHVYWEAEKGPFAGTGVPGIEDFGVLISHRRLGIGSRLMDAAEGIAAQKCDKVWLAVGLHHWYGPAQRLYAKRGYVPDGTGVWTGSRTPEVDETVRNDDELNLYLEKELEH